jgi:hypothetical protein
VRPTTYLTAWSRRDRALAEGLLLRERADGPHGIPWDVALDPESDGWLEVDEREDFAQAALDRWRAEHRDPPPGVLPVVVDRREHPEDDDG